MDFQFLDDVVGDSEEKSKGKVELIILVEIEVDLLVEVRVGEVELEGLIKTQTELEDRLIVPRKDDVIIAVDCLNTDP